MSPPEKDIYIKALEYAQSKESFTFQDLESHLSLTELQSQQMARQIHYHLIFRHDTTNFINAYQEKDIKLYFTVNDRFRLLDYIALQESRLAAQEAKISAKHATYFAVAALVVSIITALMSFYFSQKQLVSDINLPNEITRSIQTLESNSNSIRDEIIKMNQASSQSRGESEATP